MAWINSNRFDLSEVVGKYLNEYHNECVAAMQESFKEVAKEGVKRLKQESPRNPKGKKSGAYANNWTYKLETKGRIKHGLIVYGKSPTYRLAHLLENGHALRQGGRWQPEKQHIHPVNQWMNDEVVDRIIQKMEAI